MDYFINNVSDGDDARNNLKGKENTCKKKKGNGKKDDSKKFSYNTLQESPLY